MTHLLSKSVLNEPFWFDITCTCRTLAGTKNRRWQAACRFSNDTRLASEIVNSLGLANRPTRFRPQKIECHFDSIP
jgi:hypothetical protein